MKVVTEIPKSGQFVAVWVEVDAIDFFHFAESIIYYQNDWSIL